MKNLRQDHSGKVLKLLWVRLKDSEKVRLKDSGKG